MQRWFWEPLVNGDLCGCKFETSQDSTELLEIEALCDRHKPWLHTKTKREFFCAVRMDNVISNARPA